MAEHFCKVFHDKTLTSINRGHTGILKLAGEDSGFRTRLLQSYSCFEAGDNLDPHFSCPDISLLCVRVQNERSNDRRSHGPRQYANDCNRAPIQNNLLPHNFSVCVKSSVPAVVGKHDHSI
jgi:hypothetical protein